jgi:hypothetical protein
MAYFITGFSYVPQYCPQFDPINEDGTKFFDPHNNDVSNYQACRGFTLRALERGYRLDETTDPTPNDVYRFAKMAGSTKILPDIFRASPEICVNQRVKDAIERLEPLVHQFLPITLMRTKKQAYAGSYYLLVIGQALDSVIFEQSNLRWVTTKSGTKYAQRGVNPRDYRTLRKEDIEGKHLWREKIYLNDIYTSDVLSETFMRLKIKGIDTINYKKALEKESPRLGVAHSAANAQQANGMARYPEPFINPLNESFPRKLIKFIRGWKPN